MPSDSFIKENATRRASINRTRSSLGIAPPRPQAAKPKAKEEAPPPAPVTREAMLKQVTTSLAKVRAIQEQQLLLSDRVYPEPHSRAGMKIQAKRYQRLFTPRWP